MDLAVLSAVVVAAAFLFFFLRKGSHSGGQDKAIEEVLDRFLLELEEENERLLEKMEKWNARWQDELNRLKERLDRLENELLQNGQPVSQPPAAPAFPASEDPDPLRLEERYREVITLAQEGHTLDEIAKKTGRGKGELQLILELLERKTAVKP